MDPILTIEERVLFKKYYLAHDAFSRAIEQIDFVTKNRNNFPSNVLYINSLSMIFILYGKPFTNNRGIGKLAEDIIPSDLMEYHRNIIIFRDKLIAHVDQNGRTPDDETENLVEIELHIKNRKSQWNLISPYPNIEELKNYKKLLLFLKDYCLKKFNSINIKYDHANLILPDGIYGLNVSKMFEYDFYKIS